MIASYLAGSTNLGVTDLFNRLNEIQKNPDQYSTLYLGATEMKGYAEAVLLVLSIAILTATFAVASSYFTAAIKKVVTFLWTHRASAAAWAALTCLSYTIFDYAESGNPVSSFYNCVVIFISTIIDVAWKVLSSVPWWLYAAVAAAVVIDVAISTLGFWAKVGILVVAIAGIGYLVYWFFRDKSDPDDYFMYTSSGGGE